MATKSIFESPEADAGQNEPQFNIPEDRLKAVPWVVQRLSKLMSDRRLTSGSIRDVKKAAKNDGYPSETILTAVKLGKMSPERRENYRERQAKAFELFGLTVSPLEEDPAPDKLLKGHLSKLKMLDENRREISREISELCAAAKARELDVPAIKQIIRISRLDPEARKDWFDSIDNLGAIMGYWDL